MGICACETDGLGIDVVGPVDRTSVLMGKTDADGVEWEWARRRGFRIRFAAADWQWFTNQC